MFTIKCPICEQTSDDKYVYIHGILTCSENCANQVTQMVVAQHGESPSGNMYELYNAMVSEIQFQRYEQSLIENEA